MDFKNIKIFYLILTAPAIVLFVLKKGEYIDSKIFAIILILFVLVFNPIISGLRLIQSGKIKRSEFWYNLIPGWNTKYFIFLFFNK